MGPEKGFQRHREDYDETGKEHKPLVMVYTIASLD